MTWKLIGYDYIIGNIMQGFLLNDVYAMARFLDKNGVQIASEEASIDSSPSAPASDACAGPGTTTREGRECSAA